MVKLGQCVDLDASPPAIVEFGNATGTWADSTLTVEMPDDPDCLSNLVEGDAVSASFLIRGCGKVRVTVAGTGGLAGVVVDATLGGGMTGSLDGGTVTATTGTNPCEIDLRCGNELVLQASRASLAECGAISVTFTVELI